MNITTIERKAMGKIPNKYNSNKKNKNVKEDKKEKNINIKKIDAKKFGMKSIIGGMNNNLRNSNTISLSSKLSDISEKLEKYENLINKLGNEFQ